MSGSPEGFTITPSRVGFFLSLVAVFGLFWQGFVFLNKGEAKDIEQDGMIAQLEKDRDSFTAEIKELNKSVNTLNVQIARLTTAFETYAQKAELKNGSLFARTEQ